MTSRELYSVFLLLGRVFRTFLLKDFVFLVAAYLKNVLSQILQVFLLFSLRCFVNVGSDFTTFLQSVLRTLIFILFSTSAPLVFLLGLKVYEVRNMFTPNPFRYDQDR